MSKTGKLSEDLKLFKLRNSEGKKLSKSQKLAKLEKKLSKDGNLSNFSIKKNESSFLTPNTRTAFNWL